MMLSDVVALPHLAPLPSIPLAGTDPPEGTEPTGDQLLHPPSHQSQDVVSETDEAEESLQVVPTEDVAPTETQTTDGQEAKATQIIYDAVASGTAGSDSTHDNVTSSF